VLEGALLLQSAGLAALIQDPARNHAHSLAQGFRLNHFIAKTEQGQNLQRREGSGELGRSKLGSVEPLLHCQGLNGSVSFQQFGDVPYRRTVRTFSRLNQPPISVFKLVPGADLA